MRSGATIAAVTWLGCTSPPAPPVAPPAAIVSVAAVAARPAPPPPPEAPPVVSEKLAIDRVACTVETRAFGWRFAGRPRLCDATLTQCFLEFESLHTEEMRVSAAIGPRPKGFVEIPYRGMVFRGFFDLLPVAVYPKQEMRMNGFFRPDQLGIHEAKEGRLVVMGDAGAHVKPVKPLLVEAACDEVSWSDSLYRNLDDLEPMFGATGRPQSAEIGPGPIHLALTPGGKPVATIEDEAPVGAYAYQSKGRDRFVITWSDGGYIFGWVRGARVKEVATGTGSGSSGRGRGFAPIPTAWTGFRCPAEIPILARFRDRLFEVGAIPTGTVFSLGEDIAPGLPELELHHQRYSDGGSPPEFRTEEKLRPIDDAKLAVERRLLKDCELGVTGEPEVRRLPGL